MIDMIAFIKRLLLIGGASKSKSKTGRRCEGVRRSRRESTAAERARGQHGMAPGSHREKTLLALTTNQSQALTSRDETMSADLLEVPPTSAQSCSLNQLAAQRCRCQSPWAARRRGSARRGALRRSTCRWAARARAACLRRPMARRRCRWRRRWGRRASCCPPSKTRRSSAARTSSWARARITTRRCSSRRARRALLAVPMVSREHSARRPTCCGVCVQTPCPTTSPR